MTTKSRNLFLLAALAAATVLPGCAYRTSSNIPQEPVPVVSTASQKTDVLILEGTPDRKFKELGPIEVSVKKLTIFHKDPTKEQANSALVESALAMGADAVIRVTYESGVGWTTWGYMDAKGTGIKLGD
jgi:hypothetical protein